MDSNSVKQIVEKTLAVVNAQNNLIEDMSLALAEKVCSRVIEKSKEIGVRAVVAISNKGANPVLVKCMDDSYIASYDIAVNKAYTCAALKMNTTVLKELAQPGKELYGIQFTNGGKIVIFGGGNVLKVGSAVVGGLGVSGGSEEQDTFLSEYGAKVFAEEVEKCL